MKRALVLLVALVVVNRVIETVQDCPCPKDCWCRNPLLKNFRWIVPPPFHKG